MSHWNVAVVIKPLVLEVNWPDTGADSGSHETTLKRDEMIKFTPEQHLRMFKPLKVNCSSFTYTELLILPL